MCSAIVKVPSERLNPTAVRNIARRHWGLTKEQMKGMHVHHFPPRSEGGRDVPEHLYVCSPEFHRKAWHNDAYFMTHLEKAIQSSIGRKHSEETKRKKSEALKGRKFGNNCLGKDGVYYSVRVRVHGIEYKFQTLAAEACGISLQGLVYRMKKWGPEKGYEYI